MIHEKTIEAYNEIRNKEVALGGVEEFLMSNGTDLFWYPDIPEDLGYEIRYNFKIGSDEAVLFFHDTSSSNKRNQGVVVTDFGVYFSRDVIKRNDRFFLPWESIGRVIYDDRTHENVDFYRNDGEKKVSIPINRFINEPSKKEQGNHVGRTTPRSIIGTLTSVFERGVSAVERGVVAMGRVSGTVEAGVEEAMTNKEIGKSLARIFTAMAETQVGKNILDYFIELPYEKRKLILLTKQTTASARDLIFNFNLDNHPDVVFPVGHPIANQLYIGHPYLHDRYFPFDGYELEFVEDKIREYCQIMQFMGATEINIECVNSSDNKSDVSVRKEKGVGGDYDFTAATPKAVDNSGNRLLQSISQSIQLHQIYHPKKAPKLPTDMVWFNNEPSWQRTYKQRMQGSLLEHEERIETKKNRVVHNSELKELALEFQAFIAEAGVKWEKSMEEQFETQENVVLSVKVKFAPLESLQGGGEAGSVKIEGNTKDEIHCKEEYTASEKEYMEEVKVCLEESSEISPRERRLLDRLREKLGISGERAAELEATLQHPQLTEEEKEYMEELKACFEESSEISSGERRLLNRVRDKLGISEERAAEIEDMCKTAK